MTDDSQSERNSSLLGLNNEVSTPLMSPSASAPREVTSPVRPNKFQRTNGAGSQDQDEYYPEVIDIKSNKWIFELPDVLYTTPSRFQGVDLRQEMILRHKGALFIQRLFIELKLSHRTLYHAWTYFHRFYMRASFKVFGQYEVAAAAVFLACKCTENHRSYKDLIPVVVKDTTKGKIVGCKETSKEFWKWRDTIEAFECHLVELLCFDLMVELPYEYTQSLARTETVAQICGEDKQKLDSIMSMVTFYIEDSVLVGNSLCYTAKVLFETGVIYTAHRLNLPELVKELGSELDLDACHGCLTSFFEILKHFPPEFLKRFEKYKFIEREEFAAF